jgi:hypothetical protein
LWTHLIIQDKLPQGHLAVAPLLLCTAFLSQSPKAILHFILKQATWGNLHWYD